MLTVSTLTHAPFAMYKEPDLRRDSGAWRGFVVVSFVLAAFAMGLGIYHVPVDPWVRGFLAMGALFLTGSAFTLAKTLRDDHEAKKWLNKVADMRTEKMLGGLDV